MKLKYLIFIVLISSVLFVSALFYNNSLTVVESESRIKAKEQLIHFLYSSMTILIDFGDKLNIPELQSWVAEISANKNLENVWLLDREHLVLASCSRSEYGDYFEKVKSNVSWNEEWLSSDDLRFHRIVIHEKGDHLFGLAKVRSSEYGILYFLVSKDYSSIRSDMFNNLRNDMIGMFLIFIFTGILCTIILHKRISERLENIVHVLKNHNRGEELKLNSTIHDEIGELSNTLESTITRLNTSEVEHAGKERRFQSVVENAINGIVIINIKGIIQEVNPAVRDLFGYRSNEMIGRNIAFITGLSDEEHDRYIENYFNTGVKKIIGIGRDVDAVHKNGSVIPIHLSVSRFDLQEEVYFTGIVTDLRDKRKYENELILAKEKAEKAANVKDAFMSVMSHELRTPLNGILGPLNLIESGVSDENQELLLQTAIRSTTRLTKMVDNILEYIQLENESVLIERDCLLGDLIESVVRNTQELSDNELDFNLKMDLAGIIVSCDTRRFDLALTALLNNAYKFTSAGKIVMEVHHKFVGDKIHLEIDIKDSGIGIPEEKLDSIFVPFYQVDGSLTRSYEGAGLGLSIAKRNAKLLGGNISLIESEVGKGAAFKFESCLTILSQNEQKRQVSSNDILVVEDNALNRKVMKKILSKNNLNCDFAEDGKVAVQKTEEKNYGLILMDLQMPIMNGFEATEIILSRKDRVNPLIIAVTANIEDGTREKCFELGMVDFLAKPIKPSVMKKVFKEIGILKEASS